MSRVHKKSQEQERRLARSIGGRVMPGSGSKFSAKSDVQVRGVVKGEAKTTSKNFYSLKLADIRKIRKEAMESGVDVWFFQIDLLDGDDRLVVCDYNWLKDYANLLEMTPEIITSKSFKIHGGSHFLKWEDFNLVVVPWWVFDVALKEYTG